jgi:hypothetical protein
MFERPPLSHSERILFTDNFAVMRNIFALFTYYYIIKPFPALTITQVLRPPPTEIFFQ